MLLSIFKETVVYVFCSVIVRLSHFIVLPFLYRNLETLEYNLFDRIIVFSTYLTIFTVWGLDNTYARLISSKQPDVEKLNLTYIQLSLVQIFVVFGLLAIINILFDLKEPIAVIMFFCLGLTFQNIFLNYYRWNSRLKSYLLSCLLYGFLFPLITYILLVTNKLTVLNIFIASLVLNAVLFSKVLFEIKLWKNLFNFNLPLSRDIYKHSKYFGLTMSLGSLIFPLERYALDKFVDENSVQNYIVHSKLGIFISMMMQALNNTLAPRLFKSLNRAMGKKVMLIQNVYLFSNILAVASVLLFSEYIVFFITGDKAAYSHQLTVLILSIYLAINLSVISDAGHQAVGRPKVLAYTNTLCIGSVLFGFYYVEEISIYSLPICLTVALTLKNIVNFSVTIPSHFSMNIAVKSSIFFILPQIVLFLIY